MREYGVVSPRFWIGETGKALRGDTEAQLLALYLMTSPHSTMTGVFHCPLLYIAHETGCPIKGASKALRRLIEGGFCEYEWGSEVVFVLRMAAHQVGESLNAGDKRVIGLKREVEKMPSEHMKQRFLQVYGRAYNLVPDDWKAPEEEGASKGLGRGSDAPSKPGSGSGSGSGSGTGSGTGTRPRAAPFVAADVPGLDSQAWETWLAYRAEIRKPIKPASMMAAAEQLAALGAEQAAAVKHSIANGYQGLFAPKGNGHAPRKTYIPPLTVEQLEEAERLGQSPTEYRREHGLAQL